MARHLNRRIIILIVSSLISNVCLTWAVQIVQIFDLSILAPPMRFRLVDGDAARNEFNSSNSTTESWLPAAFVDFGSSTVNKTGWYSLSMEIPPVAKRPSSIVDDSVSMHAAGWAEGFLTGSLICDAIRNFGGQQPSPQLQSKLDAWFDDWYQWIRLQQPSMSSQPFSSRASSHFGYASEVDSNLYWQHVQLVLDQMEGVFWGYNQYLSETPLSPCATSPLPSVGRLMQLSADVMDVIAALTPPSERTPWLNLTRQQASVLSAKDTHCSALIRLIANAPSLSPRSSSLVGDFNLLAGHATWNVYSGMVRISKVTQFALQGAFAQAMQFTSAPGYIFSGDDWYLMPQSGMAVLETTNNIFNTTLYDQLAPTGSVISCVRALVANRLASNPQQWTQLFGRFNSGTNNNQWIVISGFAGDLSSVSLWISEQAPGLIEAADVTSILLRQGYWPSYNIPFIPFIFDLTGYPGMVAKFGDEYSYTQCPRAKIFARDVASKVVDLESMRSIMRYNDWQNDPLSLGSPANAIASRYDLLSPAAGGMALGAVDAKVVDSNMFVNRLPHGGTFPPSSPLSTVDYWLVTGPTHDQVPVFVWSKSEYKGQLPYFGQPDAFGFEWITLKNLTRS